MSEPTEPRVMRPGALQRGEGFFRLADRFHSAVDDAVGPAQLTARRLLFESAAREPSSFAPMGKPQSPSRRVKAEVAIDLELTAAATEDRRPRHLPLAAAPPARAVRRGETGALDVRHVRFRDRGLRGRGLVVFRRNKALMRDGAQAQALVLEAKQFGHTAVGE